MKDKEELVYGLLSFISFVVGFFIIDFLSLSSRKALLFSIDFADIFMDIATNTAFTESIVIVLSDLLVFVLPFIPIALGFGILASYGMQNGENKKLALIVASSASVMGIIVTGFTFTGIFFYVSIILCAFLVTGLGETYPGELGKWSNYRTGSKIATRVFFVIAVALAVGLLLHTSMNSDFYKEQYRNTTKEVFSGVLGSGSMDISTLTNEELVNQLPEDTRNELHNMSADERRNVLNNLRSSMENRRSNISVGVNEFLTNRMFESDRFGAMIEFALLSAVLAIGGIFMFFEKVLYGPVMGIVTSSRALASRIREK